MTDPLQTALGYLKRGWNPVPVSRKTKRPIGLEWQKRRLNNKTAPNYFNGWKLNVGVQIGPMSSGLTDVDLDCREALVIGALLRPVDFNSGVTRRKFFHNCPTFIAKIAFTKHVAWFKHNDEVREAPKKKKSVVLMVSGCPVILCAPRAKEAV